MGRIRLCKKVAKEAFLNPKDKREGKRRYTLSRGGIGKMVSREGGDEKVPEWKRG